MSAAVKSVEFLAMQQGSLDWFRARMGIPTASEFQAIMTKGRGGADSKTRRTYMLKLAGEILTGEPADTFQSEHMLRGQALEDEARDWYALRTDAELERIGFVRAELEHGAAGASPDSLVNDDGLLEVKTKLPHLHIAGLLEGALPDEHKAQIQGQLWLTGRAWCDYLSYWPRLRPLVIRVPRDEAYIAELATQVSVFLAELRDVVARVREAA